MSAAFALGAWAAPSQAATPIGGTFPPTSSCSAGSFTAITNTSPPSNPQYAAPSAGVITSWSFQTGAATPTFMRLSVGRGVGNDVTIVGRSERELLEPSTVNTFSTRIPVATGDRIGFSFLSSAPFPCYVGVIGTPGYSYHSINGDPAPGTTVVGSPVDGPRFPVAATLEADADGDNFGDETQDLCPSDADTVKACRDKVAPETTLTGFPAKKTKKKAAEFAFSSNEAGSFRCSLNGSPFAACTSPLSLTARKGLNTFTVFARDAAANIDETPATYSWRVKKKRKR